MSNHPNSGEKVIEDKILHILENFPKVSPSMLQISLGSGIPTALWQPILERLIVDGAIHRYQRTVRAPSGRAQVVTVISNMLDDGSDT